MSYPDPRDTLKLSGAAYRGEIPGLTTPEILQLAFGRVYDPPAQEGGDPVLDPSPSFRKFCENLPFMNGQVLFRNVDEGGIISASDADNCEWAFLYIPFDRVLPVEGYTQGQLIKACKQAVDAGLTAMNVKWYDRWLNPLEAMEETLIPEGEELI